MRWPSGFDSQPQHHGSRLDLPNASWRREGIKSALILTKTPKDWLGFSRKKPGAASLATGRLGNHGMGSLEQRNLLGLGKKSQSLVEDKAPALPWLWGLQRPVQPWWLCLPSAQAEPSQRWAGARGSVLRPLTTCTSVSWDSQHGAF